MRKLNRKQVIILLLIVLFIFITILFFNGEKLLGEGWSYIPSTAIRIAFIICFIWQILLIVFAYKLQKKLKAFLMGWKKKVITLISVVLTTGIVLDIGKSFIMYSFDLDGTLWDSTGCVCAIWNRVLNKYEDISLMITQ